MYIDGERIEALAEHLEIDFDDIIPLSSDYTMLKEGGREYLVLTEDEANLEFEKLIDEHAWSAVIPAINAIIPAIKEDLRKCVVPGGRWKKDAMGLGRGHWIASYDGHENEEYIGDTTYYIYRIA